MIRHSDKATYKKVVTELENKIFTTKDNKKKVFSHWTYQKGIYLFVFCNLEDKAKTDNDIECMGIQLYYQYIDDYANTLQLIYQFFTSVEQIAQ